MKNKVSTHEHKANVPIIDDIEPSSLEATELKPEIDVDQEVYLMNDISYYIEKAISNDKKMDLIKNVWKPCKEFKFPKDSKGKSF